jgi:hypothetical protein
MMLELEPTQPLAEPTKNAPNDAELASTAHGTVEPCQFEELLERALEIVRARRAQAGSASS